MVNIFEGEGMQKVQGEESMLDKELANLLGSLMDKKDIELKSEIANPLNLTRLKLFGIWCRKENIPGAEQAINEFIQYYLMYMVSHQRRGRLEVVKAISEFKSRIQKTLFGPKEVDQ
ncbi:MAG: hypothetical protein PHT07_23885 [Paludibacter sp.]|nr:hypothetical protein [Paludibacter sp.]